MTFRARLLVLVILVVAVSVTLVTWSVSLSIRRSFEVLDNQRTAALVEQFQREFLRRQAELVRTAEGIARSEPFARMAIDVGRAEPDFSSYVSQAGQLAAEHGLEIVELIAQDGTIVSSAHWQARFGYKAGWIAQTTDWNTQGAFLRAVAYPNDTVELALLAVRSATLAEKRSHVVVGSVMGKDFFASLVLPAGMRILLYRNLDARADPGIVTSEFRPVAEAEKFSPIIQSVRSRRREETQTIRLSTGPETFHAIPLTGRQGELLGVLLAGSSRKELETLLGQIRSYGLLLGGVGILLGGVLSYWVTGRIMLPVERLVQGAREVAGGRWDVRVPVTSADEIGALAKAFNTMTRQLLDQRERLVQAERVAAWREVARRLAHELKNPLFPLQITVENIQRAREQAPDQFDDVLRESTATLLAELGNLKTIIGRFSDFARMPPPDFQPVNLNDIVSRGVRLFEAQFRSVPGAEISVRLDTDPNLPAIQADAEQLNRALQNLILNAIDAMPAGGALGIATRREDAKIVLEVSDSGKGLEQEERERLFTPYYTTKQHGTGLGLAIVQSVVSDHRGKISVTSEPGRGTTFRIELGTSHVYRITEG